MRLIILLAAYFLYKESTKPVSKTAAKKAAFKPVTPTLILTPPAATVPATDGIQDEFTNIGLVGYVHGHSFAEYQAQRTEGIAIFNYRGNPAPYNNYPAPQATGNFAPYTADYVAVRFPSHSVSIGAVTGTAKVHYKITDEAGNLILEVYNTRGGSDTVGDVDDNHVDDAMRWLRKGVYNLWMKNIGELTITPRAGTTADANGDSIFTQSLAAGAIMTRTLDFRNAAVEGVHHSYKLNCNAY